MNILQFFLWGNSIQSWLIALAVVLAIVIVINIIKRVLVRRFKRFADKTDNIIDDLLANLLSQIKMLLWLVIAVHLVSLPLQISNSVSLVIRTLSIAAFIAQVAFWGNGTVNFWIARRTADREEAGATTLWALGLLAKIAIWSIALLLVLDNIPGVQVTSLIASLGISGIAVALAVQNILGDLFSSLTIALDRPFELGDRISVGDFTGDVEHIGLKSTRVRSLSGEEIIFSNSDLLKSRIRNFKRMDHRRSVFTLGVAYDTPYEKLRKIPAIVEEVINAKDITIFDRAQIKNLGASALEYEVIYFVKSASMQDFVNTQHEIYLELIRRFEQEQIDLPFPSQVIYLKQ